MSTNNPDASHVVGDTVTPLVDWTVGFALRRAAGLWPDRMALVSAEQGIRLSYGELDKLVDALAHGLRDLGLEPGDRVAIWAPNCSEWTLTQFATARAGLILVNINPAYRTDELKFALSLVGARALVAAEDFKTSSYVQMVEEAVAGPGCAFGNPSKHSALPNLTHLIALSKNVGSGWLRFADLLEASQSAEFLEDGLTQFDPINVQFTSGTTGSPKGATLTHRNIVNNALQVGAAMNLRPGDKLCIPVPLYHCFGMVMGNLACVIHGATMVYPSRGFDADATLKTVAAERCTAIHGVPTMFIALLERLPHLHLDLTSLRGGIMAGSPCPMELLRRVITDLHLSEITVAYGMTETSPVSFQTAVDDSLECRVSTVGRIQPHIEAKLVDDQGQTLPFGETGELCVRGYSVMQGYWNDSARTAEAVDAKGWMHTGDLATINEAGFCRIVGRAKDMIIRGGENIYPREIEDFLLANPAVEDVAVVGVPHRKLGEEVCAWVRLREGAAASEESIVEFCRGRLSHFKIPSIIRFVEAFPLTVTGKVRKDRIREIMADETS